MRKTKAIPYDYNVLCQICREKIKASESIRRWDGLIVGANHHGCFEHRSHLDMPAPPLRDQRPLPFTSPEPVDPTTENGTTSTITVTASPFTYVVGSTYPEKITFSGTGTVTALSINGQYVPYSASTIQLGRGASLVVTYTGTIAMTSLSITSYTNVSV